VKYTISRQCFIKEIPHISNSTHGLGELLRLLHHALDLIRGQAALLGGDGDLLRLARALVHGGHLQDAVGVHLEGHLDLGHAAGGGRDAGQLELAQQVVVLGHGALALEHLDEHGGLVVLVRGEGVGLLGGDDRVAVDELGHHAAHGLDAQRQRRHVQEDDVLGLITTIATKNATLRCKHTHASKAKSEWRWW